MGKTFVLLICLLGFLFYFSPFSEGEEWVEIVKGDDAEHTVFLDKDSVRRTSQSAKKDIIRVSGKLVYEPSERFLPKDISYALISYEINCNQRYLRILRKTYVYTDGTDEQSYDKQDRQWAKIEPESTEEKMHKYVCTER